MDDQRSRVNGWATLLEGSPIPLAMLRMVVPLVIVVSPELEIAPRLAASPEQLGYVPEGLGLLARAPLTFETARVLQIVAYSSAATAALGFFSRTSMLVLTLSAGWLFSLSQRSGAVLHDMHLFWLTALLAASPCGDAWSLDRWGRASPGPSLRYGVPLAFARVLLGLVYLFPGIHKLRASGLAWISAENVTAHMHAKWLQYATIPLVRVDRAPALCTLGGAFTIAFELSFVALALASRKTRLVAIAAGLVFHFSTQALFFIPFMSLWACYVVLLDGRWLAKKIDGNVAPPMNEPMMKRTIVVGTTLVVLALAQGARGKTQAWPFACYPTFEHLQGPTIPDIAIDFTKTDGTVVRLTGRERRARSQAEWGRVFRLSGAYGDRPRDDLLRDHARAVAASAGIAAADVASMRVYRVQVRTAPDAWSETPTGGVLLVRAE
ncbi:MAG: HTTM domain-containing protein [Labilithrix sp.]|nr:HTTM domain-containing protein [Labilithrix sp.]